MSTSNRSEGIHPWSKEALQRMKRGFESSFLQHFNKEAGTPSAPGDEEAFSSAKAFSMSSSEKLKSDKEGPSGNVLKNSVVSLTFH